MSVQWGQAASGICGLLDCGEYKKEEEKSLEKEILRFEQVTGKGRKFRLQNVDFTMKSGYIYGLTGRNGAGKSTLIKTILHEQSRYNGAIYVDGIGKGKLCGGMP